MFMPVLNLVIAPLTERSLQWWCSSVQCTNPVGNRKASSNPNRREIWKSYS